MRNNKSVSEGAVMILVVLFLFVRLFVCFSLLSVAFTCYLCYNQV